MDANDVQALNQSVATLASVAMPALDNYDSYKYTKRLANWQNDINKENWNMQNEYNLPVNQLKRFMDAGLNPNLIYGQTNTAGDVGNFSTSQFHTKGYDQFINLVAGAATTAAQLRQIDADTALKGVQADNVQEQTNLTKKKVYTEELNQQIAEVEKMLKEAGLEGIVSDNAIKKLEAENWQTKFQIYKDLQDATRRKLEAEIAKDEEETAHISKRYNLDFNKYLLDKDRNEWQKDSSQKMYDLNFEKWEHEKKNFPILHGRQLWEYHRFYKYGSSPFTSNSIGGAISEVVNQIVAAIRGW